MRFDCSKYLLDMSNYLAARREMRVKTISVMLTGFVGGLGFAIACNDGAGGNHSGGAHAAESSSCSSWEIYVEEVDVDCKGEFCAWTLPGGGEPFAMLTVNQVWAKRCKD